MAFLSATSTVLAAFYVPLAGVLAWKRRDPESRIVFVGYGVGLAVQALFVVTAHDDSPQDATRVADLLPIYGVRVLGSGLLGDSMVKTAWADHGYAVGAFAAVVVGTVVVALALRTRGAHLCLGLTAVAYSVFVYVGAVALRGSDDFLPLPPRVLPGRRPLRRAGALDPAQRSRRAAQRCADVRKSPAGCASQSSSPSSCSWGSWTIGASMGDRAGRPGTSRSPPHRPPAMAPSAKAIVAVPITPPGWYINLSCDRLER